MNVLLRVLFVVGLVAAATWAVLEISAPDYGFPDRVFVSGPSYLPTEDPRHSSSPFCSPCIGPHYNFMSGKLEFGIGMFGIGGF